MNAHGMQIHRCNRGSFASDVLDLLRGIAAFAVFFGHARSLFLVDYKDVENKGPGVQAFYLVTGFGHQAVMLFFVLSGFFIGGNVLHLMLSGKWSWTSYLISRFTRLYVVLLPGLLATLLCDVAGIHWSESDALYSGASDTSVLEGSVKDRLNATTFVENSLFLMTLRMPVFGPERVPTFGSNSPLWSLCNEYWYYLIFPCVAGCFLLARRKLFYWLAVVACGAFFVVFGDNLAHGFAIWLLGAAAALNLGFAMSPRRKWAFILLATGAVIGVLVLVRTGKLAGLTGDTCVGVATALLVHGIVIGGKANSPRWFQWLTERHTERVRKYLQGLIR